VIVAGGMLAFARARDSSHDDALDRPSD
jgi:hypothetical protein